MANTRKLSSASLSERVATEIIPLLPAHSTILVGLSGGVDSVVLLHLLHKLASRFSWQISALHVHHGISPNADQWSEFCVELCARLHITLHVERVDIAPLRQHGIEAAARKLRHLAFAEQSSDFIALAHHADDQVETLLLQLLRGAGVRGASAMPQYINREAARSIIRPLLNFSRKEITAYAETHQLHWMEDESNADDSYPRNFLRHRILPLLEERFPAYRTTVARSAQHFAEATMLLDELAEQDAGQAIIGETLEIAVLQELSQIRAKNLLRYFVHNLGIQMPQTVQLGDMLNQLCHARDDAAVRIVFGDHEVRRYRGKAYVLHTLGDFDRDQVVSWSGEPKLDWPALNARLRFRHTDGLGVSREKIQHAPMTLRFRKGGEMLRPGPNASNRTLKNLLQESHIPPWQRDRMPLLYCGGELVCVPGVAIAATYRANDGEAAIHVEFKGARTGNS